MASKTDAILAVLGATHVPLTIDVVARDIASDRAYTRKVLGGLLGAGLVVRAGSGLHGRPYFYALPAWYTDRNRPLPGRKESRG